MTQAERFAALRAKTLDAIATRQTYKAELDAHYHDAAYAPAAKRAKLERLNNALKRHEDRFFAFVQTISPRDWTSGVPLGWIMRELTYDDAITRGPLSVVPPASWGYDVHHNRGFAAPLAA